MTSPRERDMQRRQAPRRQNRLWWLAGAVLLGAVVVAAAWPDAPSATTRAANMEAFGLADDPYLGDPDAPIVIVDYSSPDCQACRYFHHNVLPQLGDHIADGNATVYYIQGTLGVEQDGPGSVAQECAYSLGGNAAFWSLTDRLYSRPNVLAPPDWDAWLDDLAQEQGLDADALHTCHEERLTWGAVMADLRVGQEQGVQGTPSFWVFGPTGEALSVARFTDIPAMVDEMNAAL